MDTTDRDSQLLTFDVAVIIPLAQAAVSGLLLGAVAAVVAYALKLTAVLTVAAVVAILITSFVWLAAWRWWRRMLDSMAYQAEPVSLYLGEQEPTPIVRVELSRDNNMQFIELPVAAEKLAALARGLADGKSFTESSWCSGSGGIFTRAEFCQLRDEMLHRGLLELNSPSTPARGYHLTRGGEACIRYLATTTAPLLESGSE